MTKIKLPNLDQTVIKTLDFFSREKLKKITFLKSNFSLAVGSVNAHHTARLLLADQAAIFADESNLLEILKNYKGIIKRKVIDQGLVISASGEKDAIWEIKALKKAGLKTTLLTCNPDASSIKLADKTIVSRKIAEPYSYNFSTYLGMLLGKSQENPQIIKKFLKSLKIPMKFKQHKFFSFIVPDKWRPIADMIKVKDDEMFAADSSLRAFSEGQARHAKFIYQSPRELVISFGKNPYFGLTENRWEIELPKKSGPGLVLSLGYYLVGLIQAQKPPYFKKSLADYCLNRGARPYGGKNKFKIIVPGSEK